MQNEKINPKMLTLAREARGLSQAELAELSGISRSNISKSEMEWIQMSEAYIQKLIDVLKFHPSLYYNESEVLPSELYRKRDKVPMKQLTMIDADINLYSMNISALLDKVGFENPNLPLLSTTKDFSPMDAANKLRKLWKVPKGVIPDMVELLEGNGVIIVPVDFGTERVDSRSLLMNEKYPIIFYNNKLLGDRQRYTIGYELGHLVMHTRTRLTYTDSLSHNANLFAAEFLMPKEDILKDLKGDINTDLLANLKLKWKVSMHSLLYRANDLGLINDNQKRYIINTFNLFKIRRREPKELDVPLEKPYLLRDLLTKYRTKQKMSVKQMAEFFHLHEDEFLNRYTF